MPLPELPNTTPTRSPAEAFVDVTAKLSLVMAVLAVVWSLLQLLVVAALGQLDLHALTQTEGLFPLPSWMGWISEHATLLSLLQLLLCLVFLVVCWGLFKRREWGRLGFIAFLVLVALANFASLPLVDSMFSGMQTMFPAEFLNSPDGAEMRAQLQVGRWTSLLTAVGTAIAFAALHGWLVIKLGRAEVRALFH